MVDAHVIIIIVTLEWTCQGGWEAWSNGSFDYKAMESAPIGGADRYDWIATLNPPRLGRVAIGNSFAKLSGDWLIHFARQGKVPFLSA